VCGKAEVLADKTGTRQVTRKGVQALEGGRQEREKGGGWPPTECTVTLGGLLGETMGANSSRESQKRDRERLRERLHPAAWRSPHDRAAYFQSCFCFYFLKAIHVRVCVPFITSAPTPSRLASARHGILSLFLFNVELFIRCWLAVDLLPWLLESILYTGAS